MAKPPAERQALSIKSHANVKVANASTYVNHSITPKHASKNT